MARVFVIYGQGGILTSFGMSLLAGRIAKAWPNAVVTTHAWKTSIVEIAPAIKALPADDPVILLGYSLGANAVDWIAAAVPSRSIALSVAYDPSVLSIVTQPGANVKRLLLYHNNDWEPEGHAVFTGPQVETTQIDMPHLAICYSETLHQKTLAAISLVIPKS
jgi:hypothetical protein